MRRLIHDEDGATAVIIAIVLAAIIGVLALVADAGAIYVERRELQNGADAAALAIAEDCARGLSSCGSPAALAATFADGNASDDASNAAIIAFDPSGSVTVETTTDDGAGGTLVEFAFAPIFALFGGDGEEGRTVDAQATAKWGTPGSIAGLPIIVSACEYEHSTGDGTSFTELPIDPGAGGYTTLDLHQGTGSGTSEECDLGPAGMDVNEDGETLPAGFGWLESVGCEVTTTAYDDSDWVTKDPGVDLECDDAELLERLATVVSLPIFGDFCRAVSGGGGPKAAPVEPCATEGDDMYEVLTYAGFYLTAFKLPSVTGSAPGWSSPSCAGFCIEGFFVKDVVSGGPLGGNHPGGVVSVSLVS